MFSFKTNAKQFASSAAKKVHAFKCKMTWTYRSMNGHRKASVVWYKCKKTLFSWPAASQLALNGATWRNASYCIRSFSFNVSLTKSESRGVLVAMDGWMWWSLYAGDIPHGCLSIPSAIRTVFPDRSSASIWLMKWFLPCFIVSLNISEL